MKYEWGIEFVIERDDGLLRVMLPLKPNRILIEILYSIFLFS